MRYFNLLGLTAATALSAVLCCAPLASAASAATPAAGITLRGGDQQHKKVFTLVAQNTQNTNIGEGNTQGSGNVFAHDLYRDNRRVGSGGGSCTIIRTGPDESGDMQCLATFSLTEGDITAQGVISFAGIPNEFDLAITGGTGTYRSSSGRVHGVIDTTTATTTLTFHISR